MQNGELFARMSSKESWYSAKIRANCILSRRCVERTDYSLSDMQGLLSDQLKGQFGGYGLPSETTIREWERMTPDFPDRAVTDGLVDLQEILPLLRADLSLEGFQAELHQDIPSMSPARPSTRWREALALVGVGLWLLSEASKKRPARQGVRLTGRRRLI